MSHKTGNCAGFTILELLVSIGIFVVILMAMASFSTLLIRTNTANEVRNAAIRAALAKLHKAELLQFSSDPSDSSGFFLIRDSSVAYSIAYTSSSPASNIKKIDETISYNYKGKSLSFTLSTIVLKP